MSTRARSLSIAMRDEQTAGRASGFDYLRLVLALAVVCLHTGLASSGAAGDEAIFTSWLRPFVRLILPCFFALSGYLVAGSLMRSRTTFMFMGLRVLRIYPALIVDVCLSALLIGPLVTSESLPNYFSDPLLRRYFLNALGDLQYYLPGVFLDNPLPGVVNGQLWTIVFELYGYVTLAVLGMIGLRKRPTLAPFIAVVVTVAYFCVTLYRHNGAIAPVVGSMNGALLVAAMLSGTSIYVFADRLPYNVFLGLGSGVLSMGLLCWSPYGDFFAAPPIAYFTIHLGLLNPSRTLAQATDYSYGIYLYGFVIQQAAAHTFAVARTPLGNLFVSLPLILIVAAASCHFVERPAQRLRIVVRYLETQYLTWRTLNRSGSPQGLTGALWPSGYSRLGRVRNSARDESV